MKIHWRISPSVSLSGWTGEPSSPGGAEDVAGRAKDMRRTRWLPNPHLLVVWAVLGLWIPYTVLNALFPGPLVTYALGLVLAALALALLHVAGVPLRDCFVRLAPLSRQGALLLLPLMVVLPAAWLAGRLQPWNWLYYLVYAPASALAQELYFRAGLLVALRLLLRGRERMALVLQSVLFGLWHLRAFGVVPPAPAAGIVLATFIAGMFWGMQVQRDRTILYAAIQHALFLALL